MEILRYQIFDTQDFAAGPSPRIELPFQIGWTPHGHFLNFDPRKIREQCGLRRKMLPG